MLNQMKELAGDQAFIRVWLERINETDKAIITETIDAMRINPEYRTFILNYARESA